MTWNEFYLLDKRIQEMVGALFGFLLLVAFIIAMVFLLRFLWGKAWENLANKKRKKSTMADYQELKALKELLDSGAISGEEYQSERQKIVEKWDRGSG